MSCPLVLIRWLDSRQPTSAWRYLADVGEPKAVECTTVGWLLKDNADAKVVCQSVGDLGDPENAQASGVMTIPARCILNGSNTQGWHTGALSAGGLADLRGEFLAAGSLS